MVGLLFFAVGATLKATAMTFSGVLLAIGAFWGMTSASKSQTRQIERVNSHYKPDLDELTRQLERIRTRLALLQAELDNADSDR